MDDRLPRAIATPAIRNEACELVGLSLSALSDLRKLDDSLYGRFVTSRATKQQPAQIAEGLRAVWADTFTTLEHLLEYSRKLTASRQPAAETPPPAVDDLDFGDFEPVEEKSFDLEASDIGELVAGLDETTARKNETERWTSALEQIAAIQYGLDSQYRDAMERLGVALEAGELTSVLGLLDDTTSSSNEAIHALVSAVYAAFVPDADRATVVPEYLTTLKRALKVRRGIAQLAATLQPHNDVLQGSDQHRHAGALAAIRDAVHAYVTSDVWRTMRAADRWELEQFDQQLREQPIAAARLTAEGLVKYLESLGAINQREVLLQHDQRILDDLREAITNARALIDLSPTTTHDLLIKACQTSLELRGRRPALEPLLDQNAQLAAGTSSPSQNEALIKRLEDVIAAAG